MKNFKVVEGNLAWKGELKTFGQDGRVITFSVPNTVRTRDKNTGEWKDKGEIWTTCSAFGKMAENVDKLKVGDPIVVIGYEDFNAGYTKKDGTVVPDGSQLVADIVGVNIKWHAAHSEYKKREGGYQQGGQRQAQSAPPAQESQPAQQQAPAQQNASAGSDDDFNFDDFNIDLDDFEL